jgi:hypothetical protein
MKMSSHAFQAAEVGRGSKSLSFLLNKHEILIYYHLYVIFNDNESSTAHSLPHLLHRGRIESIKGSKDLHNIQ